MSNFEYDYPVLHLKMVNKPKVIGYDDTTTNGKTERKKILQWTTGYFDEQENLLFAYDVVSRPPRLV